ncbi:MAG: potassium channel family protein [Pirellulaceae bacterium]
MGENEADSKSDASQMKLSVLLLALVFMLLVVPMFEQWRSGGILLRSGITCVILLSAVATKRRRVLLLAGLFFAAITVPLFWLTMLVKTPIFFMVGCVLDAVFLGSMSVLIVIGVLKKHLATVQSIYGAICAYLLLGLAWAMVFWAVETYDPTALYFPMEGTMESRGEVRAFSDVVYFTFVTMSTLGYGDVVPVSSLARTLAWMLSVTGLFYTAIVVAWLVSELPSRQERAG